MCYFGFGASSDLLAFGFTVRILVRILIKDTSVQVPVEFDQFGRKNIYNLIVWSFQWILNTYTWSDDRSIHSATAWAVACTGAGCRSGVTAANRIVQPAAVGFWAKYNWAQRGYSGSRSNECGLMKVHE